MALSVHTTKMDCDSEHEFTMIVSARLEDYQYTPISHDLRNVYC